jgi:Transposase DDE domain group 1
MGGSSDPFGVFFALNKSSKRSIHRLPAKFRAFFNGHYDTWCYLPMMGFVSFNDETEQYLCAAVLRPGNEGAAVDAVAILRRLVRMIRHHLRGVQIRVRLDGGFAHPAVLQFLDAQPKLEYVVAMAKNAVLQRVVGSGTRRAGQLSRKSGKTLS